MQARDFRFTGIVQGVGFRPWIYKLALDCGIRGTVFNDGLGVLVHAEGNPKAMQAFRQGISKDIPPLAKIESIAETEGEFRNCSSFDITESRKTGVETTIPADAATCPECVKELFDPQNKRYRYPFINCTHCGPRFTITAGLPYDRPQTSMASFPMCPDCLWEYKNPLDRRFHAQPTCCPDCGPEVRLADAEGREIRTEGKDALALCAELISEGKILAVKGLGGFHLVCNASDRNAVRKLRELKRRPSKPFAVMGLNPESFRKFLKISPETEAMLLSPAAPIVLAPKLEGKSPLAPEIAPELAHVGIMLPHTPIHWLLFHELLGKPGNDGWRNEAASCFLVMTSANKGGEPLITKDRDALRELKGIADYFLVHNREIFIRCDDSVLIAKKDKTDFVRRARGFVPNSITLSKGGPSVLATGSWLKNTACLTKNNKAILTQHIGDLDRSANCRALREAVEYLEKLLAVKPQAVACDLHRDFFSTRLAEELAEEADVPLFRIQHHHAHIASVLASNGLEGRVIGLALDGVGLGTDGTSWGGEILYLDGAEFQRLSHLASLKMPGGDKCAREGWRMGCAVLEQAGMPEKIETVFPEFRTALIKNLLQNSPALPLTSSLGRYFDAASALLGIASLSSYEGEAPMKLQAAAGSLKGKYLSDLVNFEEEAIDLLPLLASLPGRLDKAQASADFHATVAFALAEKTARLASEKGVQDICIAGGCCLNSRLMENLRFLLNRHGLKVWEANNIPPNDGGLSLGQAWLARKLYGE